MTTLKFKKFNIEAYKPGKSKVKKLRKVIKLSANESALGISPKAKRLISNKKINLDKYADGKSLNLRNRGVKIISCPSCARQGFQVIETVKVLEEKLSHIKTPITLSIIGCVVNGPGEAALTDIGITGGRKGNNMLYLSGLQTEKVLTKDIISRVVEEVEKKATELENN